MQTTTKSFVGQAFEELSIEEMEVLQGSGDVQPLKFSCFVDSYGIISSVMFSWFGIISILKIVPKEE